MYVLRLRRVGVLPSDGQVGHHVVGEVTPSCWAALRKGDLHWGLRGWESIGSLRRACWRVLEGHEVALLLRLRCHLLRLRRHLLMGMRRWVRSLVLLHRLRFQFRIQLRFDVGSHAFRVVRRSVERGRVVLRHALRFWVCEVIRAVGGGRVVVLICIRLLVLRLLWPIRHRRHRS